jgi:DNA polymerase II large subunit
MGRPEKAKLRKLIGSPHVLFPVGEEGGRMRSVQTAVENGIVRADFPNYFCSTCKRESIYRKCETCGNYCKLEEVEKQENSYGREAERSIEIKAYFDSARRLIGMRNDEVPSVVKGVRGTSNSEHVCEHLAKGLLRAKHGLHVNKDGTIRYDMTEMPITHFRPAEVGTSVAKLRSVGYEKDINNEELKTDDQILELFPHDIILPACPETPDERADDVFLSVGRFIDEELVKLYNTTPYFNAKKREDLVGSLFGCMSPHTSAVAVGRLVGFSKVQALLASPYIHAAMRRDCDGDEAAVMMLMDLLLNFSRKFIPSHRGGTQDAPLVLNMRIRANEVDDMIFDLDVTKEIPYELYSAAKEKKHPSEVKMEQVKNRLGGNREFTELNFTHDTSDLNKGALCSSYKTLPTMQEKVDGMMHLCKKIRAVDASDAARLIIERHFIRDTRGNLRKFSQQGFRCVTCNSKYRRPPLVGKCTSCGSKIIFTISEGSILKYMEPALALARSYNVSPYLLESLELTQSYIESIFGKEKETQEGLNKWF